MDPAAEQWARVRTLLAEALDLDQATRLRFITSLEDPVLREEVNSYLAWLPAADDPLDHAPWGSLALPATMGEGSRLAHYRIIRELGSGGMGTVYLAKRDDQQFEQRVAIKVIQHRLQSDDIVRLFRRERQILATLNHPSIARLLDGGLTDDDRPFLVMEYVDGIPIDAWCKLHALGVRQRLELFLAVCAAVQSAHQSLVIHRDLKPANILVTPDGVPKLLDFGVAKLLDQEIAETRTLAILTPRYASPEHAQGQPSGTASDVYSLGVLLFELLTGSVPFAAENPLTYLEALRHDAPPRPSTVVRDRALQRELRNDLDNIILHALEKRPDRRYSSAANFAADIRCYLDGFPILARPASMAYRASKFVRRHRVLVTAAIVLTLVAAFSLGAVLRSARIAERQRALAQFRFDQGRELARFYILEVDRLLERLPGSTPARALITGHTLSYLDRLAPAAEGDLPLQREFATAYERVAMSQGMPIFANMGDRPGALVNVEKGIQLRQRILSSPGATPDDLISYGDILLLLGHLKLAAGSPAAAGDVYLKATRQFELARSYVAHPPGRLLSRLASGYMYSAQVDSGVESLPDTGNGEAALPLFEKAVASIELERIARVGQPAALSRYVSSNEALMEMYWAIALTRLLHPAEAETHFRNAWRLIHSPGIEAGNAEIQRKVASIALAWASALIEAGDTERARPLADSAAAIVQSLLKADPENLASQLDSVASTTLQGRLAVALRNTSAGIALLDRAIADGERILNRDRQYAQIRGLLAHQYIWAGDGWQSAKRPDLARLRYTQGIELATASANAHPDDMNARLLLAAGELGLARAFTVESKDNDAAAHRKLAASGAHAIVDAHPDHVRARALLALTRYN